MTGQCVHKFAMAAGEPETLLPAEPLRRLSLGRRVRDVAGDHRHGLPTDFGFSMVAHPRDPDTCWVIPLSTPEQGRYMPDGHTAVWRTHDRGASWIRSDAGLPTHDAYMSVLREAMARDTLDPVGITFGTEHRPALAQLRRGRHRGG